LTKIINLAVISTSFFLLGCVGGYVGFSHLLPDVKDSSLLGSAERQGNASTPPDAFTENVRGLGRLEEGQTASVGSLKDDLTSPLGDLEGAPGRLEPESNALIEGDWARSAEVRAAHDVYSRFSRHDLFMRHFGELPVRPIGMPSSQIYFDKTGLLTERVESLGSFHSNLNRRSRTEHKLTGYEFDVVCYSANGAIETAVGQPMLYVVATTTLASSLVAKAGRTYSSLSLDAREFALGVASGLLSQHERLRRSLWESAVGLDVGVEQDLAAFLCLRPLPREYRAGVVRSKCVVVRHGDDSVIDDLLHQLDQLEREAATYLESLGEG